MMCWKRNLYFPSLSTLKEDADAAHRATHCPSLPCTLYRLTDWFTHMKATFGVLLFLQQRSIRWQQNDPDQSLSGQTQQAVQQRRAKIYFPLHKHLKPLKVEVTKAEVITWLHCFHIWWRSKSFLNSSEVSINHLLTAASLQRCVCCIIIGIFYEILHRTQFKGWKPCEIRQHVCRGTLSWALLWEPRMCGTDHVWLMVRWNVEEGHSTDLSVAAEADKTSQEQTDSTFPREKNSGQHKFWTVRGSWNLILPVTDWLNWAALQRITLRMKWYTTSGLTE